MAEGDDSSLESILSFTGKKEQMLTFKVNDEVYGVEILKVRELVRYEINKPPKVIPNVPPYIIGVINVRGEIIPVMDIRLKLDMQVKKYAKFDVIIILEIENLALGLIVDEVEDVVPIPKEEGKTPPNFSQKLDTSFIQFICEKKDRIISVIEPSKLLLENEQEKLRGI